MKNSLTISQTVTYPPHPLAVTEIEADTMDKCIERAPNFGLGKESFS